MNATTNPNWDEANYRYLSAALAVVRGILENHTAKEQNQSVEKNQKDLQEAAAAMPAPSGLERVCKIFSLSSFERDLLLLCAGMELNGDFAKLCAITHGDLQRAYPTLSLALSALPNVHWDAIAPNAPLRHWRLIQIGDGHALTLSPVRIDERILHYLTGIQYLDERLAGIIEPLPEVSDLVPSHQDLAERVAAVWSQAGKIHSLPVVQLCSSETTSKRSIAATICQLQGLSLWVMPAQLIPLVPSELDNLIRLWTRETILSKCALLIDCNELDNNDMARLNAIARFIERTKGFLIVTSRERIGLGQRLVVNFDVHQPTSKEQGTVWQDALGSMASQMNGQVKTLVDQFNLSAATIRAACAEAAGQLAQKPDNDITSILWDACRVQARPRLDELAQRIEPSGDWEDLVLPEAQKQVLREIAAHVRQRSTVYNNWGFGGKSARGLGISALFAGASGTGKTLGAEVLAHKLRLDLYRIDLSSVVSKYIGETEKNLRRVFDAAEQGGVILLFDEADALFGKRSEVKDARDRYANIEVSYLLQRMESYPGLAVLTTNLKSAIDTAFLRRIRFVVQFPFPDTTQRAEIWRRVFPADTPTADLDALQLARLNVAGGNIRNIALNAAFLAADAGEAVQMKHLLRAAQTEYSKLEKPLTDAEVGGWM
ncbi:ATP-binding protein [Nostoc sp. UCD121]|uniref:ATP-binding protein n=1 Tax=unclassified Nostoc TaxID=2593658 RepID=UPI0016296024|nr:MULTISPECIES: ATP-binding protein [unclassified Nostoc]MBC1224629.1 ATP-binding protein [Nostoc sp. UCD120]MBC1278269.1 ATP-binding protein [Nostoc sp. UCD121]MBC1296368.1 ATP-binding protein [Nostoc sp. UCD122]